MDDKIIVTNRGALTAKYGKPGLAAIRAAVDVLIAADGKRGLRTRLVFLDDAATMKRYGAPKVRDAEDPAENKHAVDAIFLRADPDYLMILGAPDVVPHQDLSNPTFDPPGDPDAAAYGDLPYACDAPYSRRIKDFRGPTRVVGRLPDLAGASEPSHLLAVLAHAAGHSPRPAADYRAAFALSTESWRKSTALSLETVFGDAGSLALAPPTGPARAAKRLSSSLAHFINCHGADAAPEFYGERGGVQPRALTSDALRQKVRPGTVASVECCYGAQLYDSVTLAVPIPICQHYLVQGASGYFGSTTIAYGPAEGNGAADLITQYVLAAVLTGASLGRASLMARQRFVRQASELDPVDLKTLAQFNLLGDPSVVPVSVRGATALGPGMDETEAGRLDRKDRRAKLRADGDFLRHTKPVACRRLRSASLTASVRSALANIAGEAGMERGKAFSAFAVEAPARARPGTKGNARAAAAPRRYHVAIAAMHVSSDRSSGVAAVAKEVGGRIVGYRIYEAKRGG